MTTATKPAKKTVKKTAARKAVPAQRRTTAKKAAPAPAPAKQAPSVRPLVAKVRAKRKAVLPFRERLEEAMHRELKHVGPICHPCRMNASRLAALASA